MTPLIERYLAVRHAAGFGLENVGSLLRTFARTCEQNGLEWIRTDLAIEWAGGAPSPEQRDRRLAAVRRLALFAAAEDLRHEVPPKGLFGGQRRRRPPRILTPDEINRLLEATDELCLPSRVAHRLRVLLGLLACTGLRIGEACRVQRGDFTADGCLHIRKSKFKKSRLVPLHPTAQAALADYLRAQGPAPHDAPLFPSPRGRRWMPRGVRGLFLRACAKAGLLKPASARPRLHDFRHTFAVRALERCRGDRDAIDQQALALTTYLGHSCLADTYWYLEATPELLRAIAAANQRHIEEGWR